MKALINFHRKHTVSCVSLIANTTKPPHNRHSSTVPPAKSWLSVQGNPLIKWPHNPNMAPPPQNPQQNAPPTLSSKPNYHQNDFITLCNILKDNKIQPGPSLHDALDLTGIEPELGLIQAVVDHFDSSPKLLHSMFLWAEKKPGFQSSVALFNSIVNLLGRAREFDSAWCLVLDKIGGNSGVELIPSDTFAILIRRYSRAGMLEAAIRTFEYASNLDLIRNADAGMSFFEILLDSLCKEGHVRVATELFDRKNDKDLYWIPSVRIYNILLNGWFRSRKLKHAERLWLEMKKKNVKPSVVTYGTLVEGYCRMRRVERAIELVGEMKREGIKSNAVVYNPIIDALAEAGRFKEASGMMEHIFMCESGPTISTYNSLVKGYCKAGELVGASKILKMMISRQVYPTPTTYNYFYRHFSKCRKIEEGMNLYTKMIESGYAPDRLTYHLLLKMLCEEKRLDLALQIRKEMRVKGCDMDLATSTMLTHLFCELHRFEEAFVEFEDMLRRGLVPQYLTFHRLNDEFRKQGMTELAGRLCDLMAYVPHSTNLPSTYDIDRDASRRARRTSILQKAEAMSKILKTCNDPRELVKHRSLSGKNPISIANQLIEDIKKRSKP